MTKVYDLVTSNADAIASKYCYVKSMSCQNAGSDTCLVMHHTKTWINAS
jgi:hypothetical protein